MCEGNDGEVDDSLVTACNWATPCNGPATGVFSPPVFSRVL